MSTLRIDPSSATPIWSQIEDGLRRLVASGALKPGAAVPSVRDLANDLRITPPRVAMPYLRLTDAGVLTVRRGEGTYDADAPPAMSKAERARILREAAGRFADLASTLGVAREDAEDALRAAWKKGANS